MASFEFKNGLCPTLTANLRFTVHERWHVHLTVPPTTHANQVAFLSSEWLRYHWPQRSPFLFALSPPALRVHAATPALEPMRSDGALIPLQAPSAEAPPAGAVGAFLGDPRHEDAEAGPAGRHTRSCSGRPVSGAVACVLTPSTPVHAALVSGAASSLTPADSRRVLEGEKPERRPQPATGWG